MDVRRVSSSSPADKTELPASGIEQKSKRSTVVGGTGSLMRKGKLADRTAEIKQAKISEATEAGQLKRSLSAENLSKANSAETDDDVPIISMRHFNESLDSFEALFESETSAMQQQLGSMEHTVKALSKTLGKVEQTKAKLNRLIDNKYQTGKANAIARDNEIEQLRNEMNAIATQSQESINELQGSTDHLQERLSKQIDSTRSARKASANKLGQIENLQTQIQRVKGREDEFKQKFYSIKSENLRVQQQVTKLQKDRSGTQSVQQKTLDENEALKAQLSALQEQLAASNDRVETLSAENDKLVADNTELSDKHVQMEGYLNQYSQMERGYREGLDKITAEMERYQNSTFGSASTLCKVIEDNSVYNIKMNRTK